MLQRLEDEQKSELYNLKAVGFFFFISHQIFVKLDIAEFCSCVMT